MKQGIVRWAQLAPQMMSGFTQLLVQSVRRLDRLLNINVFLKENTVTTCLNCASFITQQVPDVELNNDLQSAQICVCLEYQTFELSDDNSIYEVHQQKPGNLDRPHWPAAACPTHLFNLTLMISDVTMPGVTFTTKHHHKIAM